MSTPNLRTTVIHVITRLELGGAQENTLLTCRDLDRKRFRVILAYGPGGALDEEAEALDDVVRWEIPELVREISPAKDALAVQHLTRRILAERARRRTDGPRFIVHTHSSKAGIVGRMAAAAAFTPIVVHGIHGFGFHYGQPTATYEMFVNAERAAARVTHGFFSVSELCLKEARDKRIVLPSHYTRIVRSGMHLDAYRNADARQAECRRNLGLSDDHEVFVTIANFKAQKDPLTLIKAFAYVAKRRPKAILLFAGDGPLRAEVEAMINAERLTNRVFLLGWRRDVPDLLAASDVVVLSSIFEGLPRSAVQAVAARRPFVGTHVDGTPEIIRNGYNGYLVQPRDPHALSQAMMRGMDTRPVDPADEARLAEWDVRRMVSEQEDAYGELLARKRAR